ncbi:exodeoxyribonuclease I [Motilimonas sp. E26]|uniref:exodeoxyribonuclease I n=1 Tax=Motilimonas sp. E26 TaxID=2865674 RepID=UPI001E30720F|nr:exodeoxyribonuclease I [Motilimonas sp. E26]MCE0555430.1 exodeoxyribonuclease I [Motilimonas sp. E26]
MIDPAPSLLWHDYESFGLNPATDRPSQFAAIRTDYDLNEIADPVEIYCQPPSDYLPQPMACLITGITPQRAMAKGVNEATFIKQIHNEMSQANTCVVGYNNIRFDDEVTRNCLYRNFYDPYEREWKNGNSRWDILDMVRACYALRPEGISWVVDQDSGVPSFRLELLTKENGISHESAHDAVSDVRATIAMAKLIKQAQPKLYDYLFNLRNKKKVGEIINQSLIKQAPLVHVSGMFPALQGCASYVKAIDWHPTNRNAVILVDLNKDLSPLLHMSVAEIQRYLYSKTEDLPEGIARPALKLLHTNKCPVIATAKTLTEQRADELGIDRQQCRQSLNLLTQHPELKQKLVEVYQQPPTPNETQDPDCMIYSGGFLSQGDKSLLTVVRDADPTNLAAMEFNFTDPRLPEMLFRYRARNFPHTLNEEELVRWQHHCKAYFDQQGPKFISELEDLYLEHQQHEGKCKIIKALHQYASEL